MATSIIESNSIIDTEHHFLVKAGPGAGKTYWLIQHIGHVLSTSNRLGRIRKIACITYTNVGIETICNRLPSGADRVDVCTIHSFLYENIIKPYFHLIASREGFAIDKLKVVDDTVMTGKIFQIKNRIKNGIIYKDDKQLKFALLSATWQFSNNDLKFKPPYPFKANDYIISQAFYDEYKKYAWEHGVMHYDDVLYFAYKLIQSYPFILHVISNKYPYIFIDEFQDSTPIQIEILKHIASVSNSIIGVIGDKAQAIYGFAGTDPQLFEKFSLPGMKSYEIQGNRRCSVEIITLLNVIRTDLMQYSVKGHHSEKPIMYVGEPISCYNVFKTYCDSDIVTLSYAKATSNALRKQLGQLPNNENLIHSIPDSNWDRLNMLIHSIKAIEFGVIGAIKDALKSMKRITDNEYEQIQILKRLLNNYEEIKKMNLDQYILYLKNDIGLNITGLNKGSAKSFYASKDYTELALYIMPPDTSNIHDKTIHKAKGDEFDNVMVILKEENDLTFLTHPDLNNSKEEQRVYYVAISRAKYRLAICVPTLTLETERKLSSLPIQIRRI